MTNESLTVVTVDVTQEDIKKGLAGKCKACPIARAMRRLLRRGTGIAIGSFGLGSIQLHGCRDFHCFELPETAKNFINDFDSNQYGGTCAVPFTFKLSLPTAALRQSAIPAQETDTDG